jgi:tRNA-2-methylthio-N6-dimethylallyladenosine synthase
MFKHSKRPGAIEERKLKENVPGVTKTRRLNEIIALQNKLAARGKMKDIGRIYQALVECYSKKSDQYL